VKMRRSRVCDCYCSSAIWIC